MYISLGCLYIPLNGGDRLFSLWRQIFDLFHPDKFNLEAQSGEEALEIALSQTAGFLPEAICHCRVQYVGFDPDQGILHIADHGFIALLGCGDIALIHIEESAPGYDRESSSWYVHHFHFHLLYLRYKNKWLQKQILPSLIPCSDTPST